MKSRDIAVSDRVLCYPCPGSSACFERGAQETKKPQGLLASGFVFLASSVSTNPYGLRLGSAKSNKLSRFVAFMTGPIREKTRFASMTPLA